ncbi:MAG: AAA family ATPase [Ruminococcus sp.]|nr:AAA family ATPase [Ruminococcus sp.]
MKRQKKRLTSIEIQGYKSIPFQHPRKLEFGDINILLGANGAGKSNVISFFKMLGYMMSGSFQRFVAEAGTSQKFLYYGPKKTPTMSATLHFDVASHSHDIYSFSLTKALPDRLIISSEEMEWQKNDHAKPFHKQLNSDFNESALFKTAEKEERIVHSLLASCKVYQFSDSSISSPMRQASTVESAHYLQSEANNLASFLYYLKNNYPESFQRITEYVREIVPQFQAFYLEPDRGYISLKWIDDSPNDYVLSADQFSDGSIRFIALATLLLQPEATMPFVIIVDEPELGLHPYAIDQLSEMIQDASHHAQIIVATQSPALIDGFSVDTITVIERDPAIQGTVARHLNEQEYHDWLAEYTVSELWNKNVIGGRPI